VSAARYAIYWAPAWESPWWRFGAHWLGWDDVRGQALQQPRLPDFTREDFHALTGAPRRYGFHATLKAPFRLRDGVTEDLLVSRLNTLAAELRALPLGELVPGLLDDFVALQPAQRQPAVDALAAQCVLELDDLRAPLTAAELARRQPQLLDPKERELLQRHGYPWVLDRFRFHLTLSGPLDAVTADLLIAHARHAVGPLNAMQPARLDRLCVVREDQPGAPFLRVHEVELI